MKKNYIAPKAICVNLQGENICATSNFTATKIIGEGDLDVKGSAIWGNGGDITSSNAWDDDEDW